MVEFCLSSQPQRQQQSTCKETESFVPGGYVTSVKMAMIALKLVSGWKEVFECGNRLMCSSMCYNGLVALSLI